MVHPGGFRMRHLCWEDWWSCQRGLDVWAEDINRDVKQINTGPKGASQGKKGHRIQSIWDEYVIPNQSFWSLLYYGFTEVQCGAKSKGDGFCILPRTTYSFITYVCIWCNTCGSVWYKQGVRIVRASRRICCVTRPQYCQNHELLFLRGQIWAGQAGSSGYYLG